MNIIKLTLGLLVFTTLLAIGFYYKGWMESIITGKTVAILTVITGGALAINYFASRAIAESGIVSKAHSMVLQQTGNFQDENQEFQPPPQYPPSQPVGIPQQPSPGYPLPPQPPQPGYPQPRQRPQPGYPQPRQIRGLSQPRSRSPGRSMRRSLTNKPIVRFRRPSVQRRGNRFTLGPRRRGGTYDMNLGFESIDSLISSSLF